MNEVLIKYVPHGINSDYFRPLVEGDKDYEDFKKLRDDFINNNDVDFIIFWNNRNIRRKQPGDVLLAYKRFCDRLSAKKAKRCVLLMHTDIRDENGTDLVAVKEAVCPDYKVVFSSAKVDTRQMNMLYNLVDITINVSSAEGFGLSTAESLTAGTPIVVNVTGGLQDQCRFEDKEGNWISFDSEFTSNHVARFVKTGNWVKPVFPANRSLQGSIPTPYIFDDRCNFEDVAHAIFEWYNTPKDIRKRYGLEGREWMMSKESGMSSAEMCKKVENALDTLLEEWTPAKKFWFGKIEKDENKKLLGITFTDKF